MQQEYNVDIRPRAFRLRPDIPPEGIARQPRPGESPDGLLNEPLRSYAKEAGLVMRRPSRTPNTLPSLEATEYAYQQGRFDAFHHAAYRAFWELDKDISDMGVLRGLAEESGLDPDGLEKALREEQCRPAVQEQYEHALSVGVNGIPSFLVGRLFFSGAEPYDLFRRVIQRVLAGQGT
ncbi:MAG: DsbA family protein [Chloroflexi bacterium]|nr:DsbA family protein [Chloroflexota bacterium]